MADLAAAALAAVFGVGAAAKLADRDRSRESIVALGAPAQAAGTLQWLIVVSELAVAAALVPAQSRWAGAVAAMALLATFSLVVSANVIQGRRPECHCFGRFSGGSVSWSSVARNGLLISLAGFVATDGRQPVVFVALGVGCGAAWLGLAHPRFRVRRGALAPEVSLADAAGQRWTLERLLAQGRPLLLVFSQPACPACSALLPDLASWHARLADRLTVAVVNHGSPVALTTGDQGADYPLLLDEAGSLASAYGVTATPSAALIDRHGRLGTALAQGGNEIAELVETEFEAQDAARFGRRALIARSARGVATLGAFPLLAAACGSSQSSRSATPSTTTSSRPKAVRVGSTYICGQKYALCTNAPCVPSKHDPNIVVCDCVVKNGYSIGFHTCERRAPHGTTLYSDFSTQLVTGTTRALTCPASKPWANCVDVACELDPHDPTKARCQCQIVKQGPAFTFGGDCDTRTCSTTIWSGSSPSLGAKTGSPAVKAAMKRLGQPLMFPKPCPKA